MVDQLQSLFETCGVDNVLQGLPSFPLVTSSDVILPLDWDTHRKKARLTMKGLTKLNRLCDWTFALTLETLVCSCLPGVGRKQRIKDNGPYFKFVKYLNSPRCLTI